MSKRVREMLAFGAAVAVVLGVGIAGQVINEDDDQGSGSISVVIGD